MAIGIDAGSSLTKIVTVTGRGREYRTVSLDEAMGFVEMIAPGETVKMTGCRAWNLAKRLHPGVHDIVITDELQAFVAGARRLAREEGRPDGGFVLVGFGTGTSVFAIDYLDQVRAAGTGMGGGTLVGLGSLLLGTEDFHAIMDMAERGKRERADLLVKDIYPDSDTSPVLSHLTASNFGSPGLALAENEDKASAIVQMVVETIAVIAIEVAKRHNLDTVLVAGSPTRHPLIRSVFKEIFTYLGGHIEVGFLERGAYSGAVGVLGF